MISVRPRRQWASSKKIQPLITFKIPYNISLEKESLVVQKSTTQIILHLLNQHDLVEKKKVAVRFLRKRRRKRGESDNRPRMI